MGASCGPTAYSQGINRVVDDDIVNEYSIKQGRGGSGKMGEETWACRSAGWW